MLSSDPSDHYPVHLYWQTFRNSLFRYIWIDRPLEIVSFFVVNQEDDLLHEHVVYPGSSLKAKPSLNFGPFRQYQNKAFLPESLKNVLL